MSQDAKGDQAMRTFIGAAVVAGVLMMATGAGAATIKIGTCANSDCVASNITGHVLVDLQPDGSTDADGFANVLVTLTNNTNGFIDYVALYYQGGLPSKTAVTSFQVLSGQVGTPSVENAPNGTFGNVLNFSFDFPQSNGPRFDAGESVSFVLDSSKGALSAGLFGPDAMAHIQGLAGGASAKILDCVAGDPRCDPPPTCTAGVNCDNAQVPEPASMLLLGLGLLGLAAKVRCPGVLGPGLDRQVVVTGALAGGYCGYQTGNLQDADITALGLTLIEKDKEEDGLGPATSGNLQYTLNGNTLATPGTWSTNIGMWNTYDTLYIAFHFGNKGSREPDSFIVQLERATLSGTYNLVPVELQNGLSNIYLLGKGQCDPDTTPGGCGDDSNIPEPASMLLLGAGLLGLAAQARRRR